MFALLALTSAVCYGAADFVGGLMARRASSLAIVVISQLAGLVLLLLALPFLPAAAPARLDYVWGVVAGLSGGTGVALLYRALAVGVMAVVAPTTAVCAVAIPVLVSLALGERIGAVTTAGIGLATVAIVLVSQTDTSSSDRPARSAVLMALLAGVAIGLFYLALARTSASAGLWPLVAARIASVALFVVVAGVSRQSLKLPPRLLGPVAAGGTLDMLANLLYLLATRVGPLAVVVTLSSLYPASTVLLARVFLHEHISPRQWAGIVCAMVAVALIVLP